MLFPGHERSQNLLASSSNSSDRKLAQDHPRGEKSTLGTHPLNINSVQDNRQIYAFSDSPRPHPKNDPKLAPAHTRAHSDDKWPNGVPPAGPRNLLEHSRQFPSSWYSGVSERDRFPDAKSCTPKSNAPKLRLSPTYSKRFSGTKTTKLHGKVVEGSSSVILDCNKSSFLTGSEVNLEIHPHGTKDILQERNHESPNLHPASGSNGLVCSSLESVTLLNRKSVPTVPQASLLVMKMPGGIDMDEAIVNPKGTANKTEVSDKGSLPSPLHKDIAYVMNHSHRSSSEAASVTSAASSIAGKSSSSSISSHLRLSICNTCKKPPFRERLKGCFECSRHYHKGCAKPKDRITEDTWVCRRCLNKAAKRLESSAPSSSQLYIAVHSGPLTDSNEWLASGHNPHPMLRSDMPEAPSHPAPPSQSLLLSEKVNSTKEVASKPIHAADHIVDLSPPTYDFSRPAPYGCAATELGTEDTHEGTLKTSVKDLPVNLPFSVKGWKARVPEAEPRTDTVDRPTDIVPSSPAAAPSVADRSLKPYAKNLKRPSNLDDPQGQKLDRQLVSPGNIEARQQPLKGNVSSTLREITKTSSKENLPHSSELSPGSPHISKSEAQRSKDQASMTGLTIIESPCATTRPSQSKIISAKIPEAVEFSPPSGEKSSGESGQPIKKLCSQCHKPILGSTLMCMRCRQTKNDHSSTEGRKDSHLSVICSPKTPVAVPSQVICSTTLNEESPAEESNLGHRRARNVLSRRDYVQESPFIPETPELASGKESERLFIAVDDKVSSPANSRKLPGQLVPQKRPAAHSLLGNEHCFTKKKLNRMFKPTTAFVGANEPGLNLNKLSHGPVSSLSCIENNSQDASVQTRVETVDRGTSPRSNSSEVHDRSHSPTRRVDSPCNGPSEATSHKREISSGNDAPHKSPSFRPYSAIRSKQQRLWKTDRKFLKQPAKGAAQKAQEFKPDELAIAHFQQAMQHDHKSLRPSSAAREKGPYSPKHDREKENQSDINPNDGPDETAYNWTSRDEQALLSKLRKKGVMFEDDSSSETELTVQPSPSKPPPKDPLWCRPKSSTDLFAIAPHLRPGHSTFDIEQKRKEIAARPSRKQRRQNMSYLRQERGQRIHEEVQRIFLPRMVKVRTVENADFANLVDDGANETRHEHRSEKEMTFSEFIGAPAKPMVILTKDKQLAFRDGTRDMKGDLPRAREKFTVTNKSVACMEH